MPRPNRSEGSGNIRSGRNRGRGGNEPRKPNYRKRLNRPGQRATIPDDVLRRLSPSLYQRRVRQRELASPFIEGSPLSLQDVLRERRAAEQLEFGPVESELQRALGAEQTRSQQQTQNIGNWFARYKEDLERAKASSVQPFQSGMADVQARAGASQAASDESLKALTAQMQGDAASRGQAFSGAPSLDAAQAEASRRSVADAMTALLQSQGASTGGYFDASKGVAGSAQVSEFLREQAQHTGALKDLEMQRGEVAREKGAFRTEYLGKRRDEERTSVLENKAFGLDVAKAEQDASDDKARQEDADAKLRQDQREARRKFKLDKQKLGLQKAKERQRKREAQARLEFDKRKQRENRKDKLTGGGTKPESPASRRAEKNRVAGVRKRSGELREKVESVKSILDAPRVRNEDGKMVPRVRGKEMRNRLIAEGNDPAIVDAAAELRDPSTGYRLRPRTVKRLQALGMRIPREWLRGRGASGYNKGGRPD